ncbi:hypothetical protein OJF2_54910 [Aquisphaera giovannonii]|uniref:DUF362 domain-containing protein n=1 Tax=Aquisphaera giovannonii TaxID=406548 RepID=A0A5B9W890_9BACT|nr:DUF362 domain-containing protein [Aquisphaera giovannonii]QEH36906.1 hypothetical protein OJF2_54910 [Aquisphaera giovannonii]
MDETNAKVALIRADRRRGGVAEAMALVDADLRRALSDEPHPLLIPAMDRRAQAHPDVLSALADSVLAGGASEFTVSSVDPRYQAELWGRPAKFTTADILSSDADWSTISWSGPGGDPGELRIPAAAASCRCRIVVGLAGAHKVFRLALGLASLAALVHPADRGFVGGGGGIGPLRGPLVRGWLAMRSISGGMRPTGPERRRLAEVGRATRALAALASHASPSFSVVDAFDAGQGTIVAGADPVAVDAVAAAALGFDPMEIGHLRMAHSLGLGVADLSRITLVGDALVRPRPRLRRDPADRLLRLAATAPMAATLAPPRPHFATVPQSEGSRDAHRV